VALARRIEAPTAKHEYQELRIFDHALVKAPRWRGIKNAQDYTQDDDLV
jgi:hypothetical protein